jgi:Flp pilus assembly protein TadD
MPLPNEAIRLNPNYADAYHSRGIAYRNTGDDDRAFADLNEARRLKSQLVKSAT